MKWTRRAALAATGAAIIMAALPAREASATKIQRVVSPGGIEAWLVRDATVPLVAINYAIPGGAAQDDPAKPGVANMVASLLDEGAGDLDARTFHERIDRSAVEMQFSATRDHLRGSLRTLTEHRDEAFELLRLALTAPRFDAEAIERIRVEITSSLRRQTTSPNDLATRRWWEAAFGDHPYGRAVDGTLESVAKIDAGDLRAAAKRILARDGLKIAVVGDIDAATLGPLLDRVFGALPAKTERVPVPRVQPKGLGETMRVSLDVPQTVIAFGGPGIARSDPDFMAAYVVNHILGGGSLSSRLYSEVREKRGLAYSIYQGLLWLDHTALFLGRTATQANRAGETIEILQREIRRIARDGPTEQELAEAKSYLKGSQMLALDTSSKIASQLVQYQIDNLGIDYIDRRNGLIDAITIEDARRAAKRLLGNGLMITVVGRTQEAASRPAGQ
jgi:zinc protease